MPRLTVRPLRSVAEVEAPSPGPPDRSPRPHRATAGSTHDDVAIQFPFDFDRAFQVAALPFGITPDRAGVVVDDDRFTASFGPWVVSTPVTNIRDARVTGPYNPLKVIGGAHLSFADRGLTFGTNARQGACICFVEPVPGIEPSGRLTHPGLTVTVREPAALVELLRATVATTRDPADDGPTDLHEVVRDLADDLHGMTAAELRARARDLGLRGVAKLRKAELIDLLEADRDD
jgi:hypothetical protein